MPFFYVECRSAGCIAPFLLIRPFPLSYKSVFVYDFEESPCSVRACVRAMFVVILFRVSFFQVPFLLWALTPPGFMPELHLGVRSVKSKKLMAIITGVPATVQ